MTMVDFDVINKQAAAHQSQEKKAVFLRFFKVPGIKYITTVKLKIKKKRVNKEVQMTMVNFNNKVLND